MQPYSYLLLKPSFDSFKIINRKTKIHLHIIKIFFPLNGYKTIIYLNNRPTIIIELDVFFIVHIFISVEIIVLFALIIISYSVWILSLFFFKSNEVSFFQFTRQQINIIFKQELFINCNTLLLSHFSHFMKFFYLINVSKILLVETFSLYVLILKFNQFTFIFLNKRDILLLFRMNINNLYFIWILNFSLRFTFCLFFRWFCLFCCSFLFLWWCLC